MKSKLKKSTIEQIIDDDEDSEEDLEDLERQRYERRHILILIMPGVTG